MMRPSLVLCCALLGLTPAACGPRTSVTSEPGLPPRESEPVDDDSLTITVAGRAEVFPEAARLLEARGQPVPTLDGIALSLEEPLRAGVSDADSVLGTGSIGPGGDFSVPAVPVRQIHLSLAASLEHEGLVRSSTLVFDTASTRTRPRTDLIHAHAWALPLPFHDALTQAVGEQWLRVHTDARARTLRDAGFILGRIVDASGAPVAGARVVPDREDLADRIHYPSPDFQSTRQDATSATGLFLYVHSGAGADTFTLSVQGARDYLPRHAVALSGRGLVLTLYPGRWPPPVQARGTAR